jgi:hypothetical protein
MKISKTALIALAALALSTAAFAETLFTANLVAPAGTFARSGTAPVVIHIDHYSEDAQINKLAGILQQKGANALRDALWDQEVGYIRVGGGLGYPIAAARSRPDDNGGQIIRMMIDRPISQREVIDNSRTMDYPFAFVEIKLDGKGQGTGELYQAAKVSLNGDTLKVENYSPQPLKLLAVRKR